MKFGGSIIELDKRFEILPHKTILKIQYIKRVKVDLLISLDKHGQSLPRNRRSFALRARTWGSCLAWTLKHRDSDSVESGSSGVHQEEKHLHAFDRMKACARMRNKGHSLYFSQNMLLFSCFVLVSGSTYIWNHICLSLSDLFHLAECPLGPSMLSQIAGFIFFLTAEKYSIV